MPISSGRAFKILIPISASIIVAAVLLIATSDDPEDRGCEDLMTRLAKLRSIPYTSVTAYPADPSRSGVMVHDPDKACGGYNIYCSHIYPKAFLMDMTGKVVHQWSYQTPSYKRWNHVLMLDNGDLLVINKFNHLLKLDWNSDLLWMRPMEVHHEVYPAADHTLYVILRETHEHRGHKTRFSAIAHLTSTGEEIFRWSTYDHLDEIKEALDRRSFLDTILDSLIARGGRGLADGALLSDPMKDLLVIGDSFDYFHLNTVTVIPDNALGARDARFRAGNLLICSRNVNQIAVLDKDTWKVLWAWGEGMLEGPHHPTMLENGNILLFDNGVLREFSRVIELNPTTERIEWEYTANPPSDFYSYGSSSAQRLPNGNTLICDGNNGRAFEVTNAGEIVWEWMNPAFKDARREQVYRMMRLPPERVEPLLEEIR